jgi:hypothetical protein
MHQYHTHICIVSGQPIPNYIPVLDKDFRPKEVILLVTEQMHARAEALTKVLKERCGCKVQSIAIKGEYDMQEMKEKVLAQILKLKEEKENIALNLTGGTKPMAIAAYNTFRDADFPTFYFTERTNEVLQMESGERFILQPPKIHIEDYFQLYGYPVRSKNKITRTVPQERQKIGDTLVADNEHFARALSTLNYDISEARRNNPNTLTVHLNYPNTPNLKEIINLLEKHKLLTLRGSSVQFINKDALQYANGGWLEEYVFNEIKNIPNIQDIALNIEIENERKGIKQNNELDVAFLHKNILYILECKTKNYKGEEQAQHELYKLETLKKLGGIRTQTAFLSYRELPFHIRDRAEGADIEIIEQEDIAVLRKTIENWITAKN